MLSEKSSSKIKEHTQNINQKHTQGWNWNLFLKKGSILILRSIWFSAKVYYFCYLSAFSVSVYLSVYVCVLACVFHRAHMGQFSPSATWVTGIKLRFTRLWQLLFLAEPFHQHENTVIFKREVNVKLLYLSEGRWNNCSCFFLTIKVNSYVFFFK